jgi:uncharacterized protein YaeQ
MALKSTIFKATLDIVDIDRNYYNEHQLTLACHPSETAERMMVRLLAFALNAHDDLLLGKGLSDQEEPDLWRKNLTGEIELWIELGHPDEKRIMKACGRAGKVVVYPYSATPSLWWNPIASKLERAKNLSVISIDSSSSGALAAMADRTMKLQFTIEDGEVWVRDERNAVHIEFTPLR